MINIDVLVVTSLAIAAVFGIFAPVVLALVFRYRLGAPWRFLTYGALIFVASQLVVRAPVLQVAQGALGFSLEGSTASVLGWLLLVAVTAGLFQEGGRYLGYRFLLREGLTWRNGLMYGAGHGGMETLMIGGITMLLTLANYAVVVSVDPAQPSLSPEQLAQLDTAREVFARFDWWTPLASTFERGATLAIHLSLSIVVLQVVLRRDNRWLYGAIAFHAIVNFSTALASKYLGVLSAEVIIGAFAILGIVLIVRLRTPAGDPSTSVS